MAEVKGGGQAYLIADERYFEIEELIKRTARALGVSVRILHFPVMPVVIAGHISRNSANHRT